MSLVHDKCSIRESQPLSRSQQRATNEKIKVDHTSTKISETDRCHCSVGKVVSLNFNKVAEVWGLDVAAALPRICVSETDVVTKVLRQDSQA